MAGPEAVSGARTKEGPTAPMVAASLSIFYIMYIIAL
jgi:hypothetical protein